MCFLSNFVVRGVFAASILFSLLAIEAPRAKADTEVVQVSTVVFPVDKAHRSSAARMAPPVGGFHMTAAGMQMSLVTTIYTHGSKVRANMGMSEAIIDRDARKFINLAPNSHSYEILTFHDLETGPAVQNAQVSIQPTGKTQLILGHHCRCYQLSLTSPAHVGTELKGNIWAAPDLPSLAVPIQEGPFQEALQSHWGVIKGMPLLIDQALHNRNTETGTIKIVTKSVASAPLPAWLFSIPKGYFNARRGFSSAH